MIFNLKNIEIDILKTFDGKFNYFNVSCLGDFIVFRREFKYENTVLISDIIDNNENVLLEHKLSDKYLISCEDARIINDENISFALCKRYVTDFSKIKNVEFKKYNTSSKKTTDFKTQKSHFEKNWQFINQDKIIYHIDPYTVINEKENVLVKKELNFKYWRKQYGEPKLSTNIFTVNNKKYTLFHSNVVLGFLHMKYYIGLLRLDAEDNPIGYYVNPFFESNREYSDPDLLTALWEWRRVRSFNNLFFQYEVIFPMNVVVDEENINIYSGLNDCSAVNIKIQIKEFEKTLEDEHLILFY
jgi:hypothetical protein